MARRHWLGALLTCVLALAGCSGSGGGGAAACVGKACGTGSPRLAAAAFGTALGAYYPQAAHWNEYVRNDGPDPFSASGTPCDATEVGPWGTCLHGGEMRAFAVPGVAGCDGLTAHDDLGAFDWTCEVTGSGVRMVTGGLKDGVHLSDLIDFDAADWRPEVLRVDDADGEIFATPAAPWWGNPIVVADSGGTLDTAGAVYIVTGDAGARFNAVADHVALAVRSGATLRGAGVGGTVVKARDVAFFWLEGRIDAVGEADGVRADGVAFSVFEALRVQRAAHAGLFLIDARSNRLRHVAAFENDAYGVRIDAGTGNLIAGLAVAGNAVSGLTLNGGSDNRVADLTATGNGNWGVALRSTWYNVLADVTAANQLAYGVWLDQAPGNTLMNVAAANNGTAGLYIFDSSGTALVNVASTDNGLTGIGLSESSNVQPTGEFVLGGNTWDCTEQGGIHPGLTNITCAGRDGFDPVLTQEATLGVSFKGPVFTDDAVNGRDTAGAAVAAGISDWLNFDGPYRHFGRNAVAFPEPDNQGRCGAVCRIWDWRIADDDYYVRALLEVPDGSMALAHFWGDATLSVFLPNAVEMIGDGIGNDNVLCETGETCLFTPNIASDQGGEPLVARAAIGAGGAVEDVTLLSHGVLVKNDPPDPEADAIDEGGGTDGGSTP
jgi:parallel beta-helix repeat protein